MNIHRNVLQIVAGTLLMVSLPAAAQVLGGSVGGAAQGTLGGSLGGAAIHGRAAAAGNAPIDGTGTFGSARSGVRQIAGVSREATIRARGAARSNVEAARGTTEASIDAAYSAGVKANRRAARSTSQANGSTRPYSAAQVSTLPSGELLVNGSSGASTEQHVAGRRMVARGAAGSQTSADRSGLTSNAYGQAGVSIKTDEPVPTETAE
jgi:hypothetical protein